MISECDCGQSGHGHFGHFRFRERGHCSLYINNNIYIIVADLTSSVFDFDHFDLDHHDRKEFFERNWKIREATLCLQRIGIILSGNENKYILDNFWLISGHFFQIK